MLGDCDGQGDRVGYLQYAAQTLAAAGARVYLDAGHSGWLSAEEAARRIELVGLDHLDGFALNVSNYHTTVDSVAYGERVAELTGGAHYVIDTSRNGNGSNGEWCNARTRPASPASRTTAPTSTPCCGSAPRGPTAPATAGRARQWFGEIALELARNAAW